MPYWVLTENGTVVSRTNVSGITNPDTQTDENKASITALYKTIQEHRNDKAHVIVEEVKGKLKYWSEHPFDRNPGFQEEFSHEVSNEEIAESDDDLYPYVYDDTYHIMELSLPKRGEPEP